MPIMETLLHKRRFLPLNLVRTNLVRPNFHLQVIKVNSEDEKMIWLASNLNNLPGTGLIYTGTRVDTEIYAKWLQYIGINAIDYNAGYDAETRKDIEIGLINNKENIIWMTYYLVFILNK